MEGQLTPNQLRFAQEYAVDLNATRAYLRAFPGVTYNTAATEGPKLLGNPWVKAEVRAAVREHCRRCGIDARKVLRELAVIGFADLSEFFDADTDGRPTPRPWDQVPRGAKRALQSVKIKKRVVRRGQDEEDWIEEVEEVEFKLKPTLPALDLLCRYLGLTKDGAALEKLLALLGSDQPGNQPPIPPAGEGGGTGPAG